MQLPRVIKSRGYLIITKLCSDFIFQKVKKKSKIEKSKVII